MSEGYVLLFNRKESEHGYPYINVYNLICVEVDKEEWDEDPYIVLSRSNYEVSIGSWEEDNDYQSRVTKKINKSALKGKYLKIDKDGYYLIYNADTNETTLMAENQEKITHNLGEFLCNLFLNIP